MGGWTGLPCGQRVMRPPPTKGLLLLVCRDKQLQERLFLVAWGSSHLTQPWSSRGPVNKEAALLLRGGSSKPWGGSFTGCTHPLERPLRLSLLAGSSPWSTSRLLLVCSLFYQAAATLLCSVSSLPTPAPQGREAELVSSVISDQLLGLRCWEA